ncbi:MAG: glycerol-3-phosphate dehydrogenase/oxidase [Bacteroidales bacterium]|nr:glycerol-3-phosphate dehydrogenase/oxidase [Candidatus Sodaliphilus aphodohippi]
MNRQTELSKIRNRQEDWDFVVIGGGATGLGCAVDAATRGFSVLLLEKDDFAKCTSSRSTKLVHGGVRYLQKGDVRLVLEALRERGRMKANAPHLVKDQAFVISNYRHWDNFLYFCGLTFYDMLSFGFGYGRSLFIGKKKVARYLPTSIKKGLKGGIVYHDGQFDDSRMAINLAQTCVENGGCVINHITATKILHNEDGRVCGVVATDNETGEVFTINAKAVINAAGIFVDDVMKMDQPGMKPMVRPSQGVHLVLDMKFLQSDYALMVPKTSDGRVLFAVPWHNRVVVGTTDVLRDTPESEPRALDEEIDFILSTAGLYMNPAPTRADIMSVYAGQRPLAAPQKEGKSTKEISRSHKIIVSDNKLVTITGGKWTSYRLMAEDTIDKAISMGLVEKRKCVTRSFHIHGYRKNPDLTNHLYVYGSEEAEILKIQQEKPEYAEKISERYDYTLAEVVWAVREEMALTLDDVLSRRVRLLYIDSREAMNVAPRVARLMAQLLGRDEAWITQQVEDFTNIASNYIID